MSDERVGGAIWPTADMLACYTPEWLRAKKTLDEALNPPQADPHTKPFIREYIRKERHKIAHRVALWVKILHPEEAKAAGVLPLGKVMKLLFQELELNVAGLLPQAMLLGAFAEDIGFQGRIEIGKLYTPESTCRRPIGGSSFKKLSSHEVERMFANTFLWPGEERFRKDLERKAPRAQRDLLSEIDSAFEEIVSAETRA